MPPLGWQLLRGDHPRPILFADRDWLLRAPATTLEVATPCSTTEWRRSGPVTSTQRRGAAMRRRSTGRQAHGEPGCPRQPGDRDAVAGETATAGDVGRGRSVRGRARRRSGGRTGARGPGRRSVARGDLARGGIREPRPWTSIGVNGAGGRHAGRAGRCRPRRWDIRARRACSVPPRRPRAEEEASRYGCTTVRAPPRLRPRRARRRHVRDRRSCDGACTARRAGGGDRVRLSLRPRSGRVPASPVALAGPESGLTESSQWAWPAWRRRFRVRLRSRR